MNGLKGKRVVMGGGSTGIGAALAVRLIDEGAHVVVGDINEQGWPQRPGLALPAMTGHSPVAGLADFASHSRNL